MKDSMTKRSLSLDAAGLDERELVAMLRNMLLQRQVDNRAFQLNRQGKCPFAVGSEGHEAVQAGAAAAFIKGSDYLVPYYRDLGLALGAGVSARDIMLSIFARGADPSGGRQFPNHNTDRVHGIVSISSIIAAHCSHAVGIAYAIRYRGESGRAVLCCSGDGATSHGEWHESVNVAAVAKLPVVFLVENNGWAISTPQSRQMAIADIADKASGYGMPGVTCDGTDPIATYRAVKTAMELARSGGGPTLVEAKCYRLLAHSTDDDDRAYRDRLTIDEQRKDDPVPKFEQRLLAAGIIDDAALAALRKAVLDETNEATDAAEAMPPPAPAELYTNVYAGPHDPWLA